MAPGHESLVYTHTDRAHLHNHIVINAVSFETGRKYEADMKSLYAIREASDNLCREHGLSVVNEQNKAQERFSMAEYKLAERGVPLWKDELRTSIDEAKKHTKSLDEMKGYLKDRYGIEMKIQDKNVSFLHPEKQKFCRGKTLGAAYTKEGIAQAQTHNQEKSSPSQGQTRANASSSSTSKLPSILKDTGRSHDPLAALKELSHSAGREKSQTPKDHVQSKTAKNRKPKSRAAQQKQGPSLDR